MENNLKKTALMVWSLTQKRTELFGPWLQEQGYEVEISDSLEVCLNADKLKSLSLIVPV